MITSQALEGGVTSDVSIVLIKVPSPVVIISVLLIRIYKLSMVIQNCYSNAQFNSLQFV